MTVARSRSDYTRAVWQKNLHVQDHRIKAYAEAMHVQSQSCKKLTLFCSERERMFQFSGLEVESVSCWLRFDSLHLEERGIMPDGRVRHDARPHYVAAALAEDGTRARPLP